MATFRLIAKRDVSRHSDYCRVVTTVDRPDSDGQSLHFIPKIVNDFPREIQSQIMVTPLSINPKAHSLKTAPQMNIKAGPTGENGQY